MMLDHTPSTTGLLLSKERRLFGLVELAVFEEDASALRCVSEWREARELLVESHFDFVMIDESAVVNETFESFSSFIRVLAAENTVCAFFVRTMTAELRQTQVALGDALYFVAMDAGKESFLQQLSFLKKKADVVRDSAESQRQTVSLDQSTGRIEVDFPPLKSGDLSAVPFARLVYSLRYRRFFGRVKFLPKGRPPLELRFVQGRLVQMNQTMIDEFLYLFKRAEGSYIVTEDPDVTTTEIPENSIEPIDLIWQGISTQADILEIERSLQPFKHRKLIPTNLYRERRVRYSGLNAVTVLIEACQKNSTLERATEAALRETSLTRSELTAAAYFTYQTDMLLPQQSPCHRIAQVVYPRDVRQNRQRVTDKSKRETKAYQVSTSDRQCAQVEEELKKRAKLYESASPYEILGVWEGCGKKTVNEMFYKATREHHPDVYGGNVSKEIKKLADRVFVCIQKARSELLRREGEQTRSDPNQFFPNGEDSDKSDGNNFFTSSRFQRMARETEAVRAPRTSHTLEDPSSDPLVTNLATDLGSEISDPEIRKQRIRALHERRRRLSSVNNMLTSYTLGQRSSNQSHSSFSEYQSSTASNSTPSSSNKILAAGSAPKKEDTETKKGRLERLSNFSQNLTSSSYINATVGVLAQGLNDFKEENWDEALRQLILAQRFVHDKKIDALIVYARYKVNPSTRDSAISQLQHYCDFSESEFDALRLLGFIHQEAKEWELAQVYYKKALKIQQDEDVQERLNVVSRKPATKSRSRSSLLNRWFSK